MGNAALLIDSDVFLVLAGAGLLERAVELLGFDKSQVLRLSALPHMIGRSRSIKRRYSADARQAARLVCDNVPAVSDRPDDAAFQKLLAVPRIDDGEALLLAWLVDHRAYLLASGDKECLRALATDTRVEDIRATVAGRVACLETILRLLVENDGAAAAGEALIAVQPEHDTLRVVFSPINIDDDEQCIAAIDSAIAALERDIGEGFLYKP